MIERKQGENEALEILKNIGIEMDEDYTDDNSKPKMPDRGCGHKVGPDIEKYQEVYDVLIRTTKESRGIIFPV